MRTQTELRLIDCVDEVRDLVALLDHSRWAFNQIPNTRLNKEGYKNTYDLVYEIEQTFKRLGVE